jgi:hypothetical protein
MRALSRWGVYKTTPLPFGLMAGTTFVATCPLDCRHLSLPRTVLLSRYPC